MGSVGAGGAMLVVSCGRKEVQSPQERLEQRHGHRLPQHPCPSSGLSEPGGHIQHPVRSRQHHHVPGRRYSRALGLSLGRHRGPQLWCDPVHPPLSAQSSILSWPHFSWIFDPKRTFHPKLDLQGAGLLQALLSPCSPHVPSTLCGKGGWSQMEQGGHRNWRWRGRQGPGPQIVGDPCMAHINASPRS